MRERELEGGQNTVGVRASLEEPRNMWRGSGGPDEGTRSSVLDIGRELPREKLKKKKAHIAQVSHELVAKIGLELLTPDFLPPLSKYWEHRNILVLPGLRIIEAQTQSSVLARQVFYQLGDYIPSPGGEGA